MQPWTSWPYARPETNQPPVVNSPAGKRAIQQACPQPVPTPLTFSKHSYVATRVSLTSEAQLQASDHDRDQVVSGFSSQPGKAPGGTCATQHQQLCQAGSYRQPPPGLTSLQQSSRSGRHDARQWLSRAAFPADGLALVATCRSTSPSAAAWLADIAETSKDPITVAVWGGSGPADVVYQNLASRRYYGELLGAPGSAAAGTPPTERPFNDGQSHLMASARFEEDTAQGATEAADEQPAAAADSFLRCLLAYAPEGSVDEMLEALIEDQVSLVYALAGPKFSHVPFAQVLTHMPEPERERVGHTTWRCARVGPGGGK